MNKSGESWRLVAKTQRPHASAPSDSKIREFRELQEVGDMSHFSDFSEISHLSYLYVSGGVPTCLKVHIEDPFRGLWVWLRSQDDPSG